MVVVVCAWEEAGLGGEASVPRPEPDRRREPEERAKPCLLGLVVPLVVEVPFVMRVLVKPPRRVNAVSARRGDFSSSESGRSLES